MIPCPLTTFVLTYALAKGVLASGLLVTCAMAAGMVITIGGVALAAALARDRLMGLLVRSEGWRHHIGLGLEGWKCSFGSSPRRGDTHSIHAPMKRAPVEAHFAG